MHNTEYNVNKKMKSVNNIRQRMEDMNGCDKSMLNEIDTEMSAKPLETKGGKELSQL